MELVEHPSDEKFFEYCTNCASLLRPLSRDHFCENSASLLFHSLAGERKQFSQYCYTIRTKELICMWVCVFINFNTSSKSMWVNDRHKSVQKSLSWRPAQEIYPNLSKIKTLLTNQIHFHASNNSDDIMKFPPIIAKNVKKKQHLDLISF